MFISLMTEQTEATEIKMNMRNINIITARSVPYKSVSDNFMNAVLSNCTTRIVLPALKEFGSESLPHNFNMAAVGVMKKGMSMSLFSSPGNTVVFGQPCAGKTNLTAELISAVVGNNKKGEGQDTCMTMEQANEKAKKLEQSSEAKPVAASLPRLAEGNFRTMPVQTVTATTPSGSRPAVTAHPEQKLLAPRPLFTAAREVKTIVPVSSVAPVTPPRPLRTGEQTAALWIAPYIDNQDVYHQPSSVFFVIKPSAWGKPRIN